MKNLFNLSLCAFAALILLFFIPVSHAQETLPDEQKYFVTIGTGGLTGIYYPAGKAICELMKRRRDKPRILCTAEPTAGAIENLRLLKAGRLDLGLTQSDSLIRAYRGLPPHVDKVDPDLRFVFTLFPQVFTIVATARSGIENIEDIKGKRLNIGNPGSGHRETADAVFSALGWSREDFQAVKEMSLAKSIQALCKNDVDAFLFMDGLPSGLTQEATISCDNHLVQGIWPDMRRFYQENPVYRPVTIPGNLYRRVPEPVSTFGVLAALVSSTNTPEAAVYDVTKAVFEGFKFFKATHPALQALDKHTMVHNSTGIPYHPGALKYYREAGLISP